MRKGFSILMILLAGLAAPGALAQNSDLGLLLGFSIPGNSVGPVSIHTSAGATGQVNYSYQLHGSPVGDLYVEFPVVISATGNATVTSGFIGAAVGTTVLFTPGVRYKLKIQSRLSLYGAAGGGIGAFGGNRLIVTQGHVEAGQGTASPVLDFGGGIDVRLTRLLSVRFEVRDFIGRTGLGGVAGHNHVIGQGGVAFHF
jgi:hypothetical protein